MEVKEKDLEVEINKEIRDYKENVILGLTLRQTIIVIIAVITELLIFYFFQYWLELNETIMTILYVAAGVPFALLFVLKVNNLKAEELIVIWFKFKMLQDKHLMFKSENIYATALNDKEYMKSLMESEVEDHGTV